MTGVYFPHIEVYLPRINKHLFKKDLSLLLGSFAGSMSVETIGNSVSINKKNFLRQIEFSLK